MIDRLDNLVGAAACKIAIQRAVGVKVDKACRNIVAASVYHLIARQIVGSYAGNFSILNIKALAC